MVNSTLTANWLAVQPRNIAGLIAIYESNYVRLMRLAPELDRLQGTVKSQVADALDLYLTVVDRFKYTTTLTLTYRFVDASPQCASANRVVFEPDAKICVYHDARTAEVISHCRRAACRHIRPWRRGHMPELERKWELNRFLQKWLGFCQRQGHLFLYCTSTSTSTTTSTGARLERESSCRQGMRSELRAAPVPASVPWPPPASGLTGRGRPD